MAFQPEVNQPLAIGDKSYLVAQHPVAPGMPYGQEGRQAVVYQLVAGADCRALKVFKPRFRVPTLVTLADRLAGFGKLPGLSVCLRTVFTARRHTALLQEYPDLIYAVLMPWVDGPTWMEVLLDGEQLPPERALTLAHALADILSSMQEEGVAHCDLSGPNLILPLMSNSRTAGSTAFPIQLVDVEQLFGPGLDRPKALPSGSQGYAHKTSPEGLWEPNADRFAGAILLAEMLGMCDKRVVQANWGENYFDPAEMQQSCERFNVLSTVLAERWGRALAELLERTWASETLDDCPTFGEWFVSLPETIVTTSAPVGQHRPAIEAAALPVAFDTGLLDATKVVVRDLINQAEKYTAAGYLGSALATFREALSLAPPDGKLRSDLLARLTDVDVRIREGEEARFAPEEHAEPYPVPTFTSLAGGRTVTPTVTQTGPLAPAGMSTITAAPAMQAQPVEPAMVAAAPPATEPARGNRVETRVEATKVPAKRTSMPLIGGGIAALLVVVLLTLILPDGSPLHSAFSGALATGSPSPSTVAAVVITSPTPQPPTQVEASPTASQPTLSAPTAAPIAPTVGAGGVGTSVTPTKLGLRVNSLAVSPDGSLVAAGTSNNTTQLVDVAAKKEVATLKEHAGWVTGVAFSPDGKTLATSSTDNTVRLWNMPGGKPGAVLKGHKDWVTAVAFARDGKTVVSGSNDGTLRVWSVPDGAPKNTLTGPATAIMDIAFSPDGALFAAGYKDGAIWLWSVSGTSPSYTLAGVLDGVTSVTALAFSKNNLVAAASSNEVYTWDAHTLKRLVEFKGHTNTVNSISFSPDGTVLASSSQDSTIKLWRVSGGNLLRTLDSGEPMSSVLYLLDGKALVAGSQNGGLQFYGVSAKP